MTGHVEQHDVKSAFLGFQLKTSVEERERVHFTKVEFRWTQIQFDEIDISVQAELKNVEPFWRYGDESDGRRIGYLVGNFHD